MKARIISKEEFITKSKNIHGDRFIYDLLNLQKISDPITLVCREHGAIRTTPRAHLTQKWGCMGCASRARGEKSSLTTEKFISKAQEVHGFKYDYSSSVYESNKKIVVTCPNHGPFEVRPMDHIHAKSGCTKCSGNFKWSTQDFINRAKSLHGELYDYSQTVYTNCNTKVIISCPRHGEFHQAPVNHIHGRGCPKCSLDRMVANKIAKGHAIAPELKDPFELYRDTVRKLSNHNFRKYYHDINPQNLKRGKDWHLDHIISIAAGFTNGLPAEQIAHPSNLRMLSAKENRSKNVYSCDAISSFDPNHIKTKELGELAFIEKRKKHSNVYQITDTHTGEVKVVELLIDWCNERGYSVSSARWSANYTTSLFKDRYLIKKVDDRKPQTD